MMQAQEIENVKGKIRKLMAQTTSNGCSEGEAMNAANLIGKLLQTYDLSMDAILLGAERCVDTTVETSHKRRHPVDSCVVMLAKFAQCKVWIGTNYKTRMKVYHFFGLPADTEMAVWLYSMIYSAMESELSKYKKSKEYYGCIMDGIHGRRLNTSFQRGMAYRISDRLDELSEERNDASSVVNPITGTSIVLIKRNKVESEFEQLGMRLGKGVQQHRAYNPFAFSAGHSAGDRVSLNRPLGSGNTKCLT